MSGHAREDLAQLLAQVRACRVCVTQPIATPLPHPPSPIFQIEPSARIAICSQAPGQRAHASGVPFNDPSGERLRAWLSVSRAEFYDAARVAIVPMGLCFPGYDSAGGDLPPRRECAPLWRPRLMAALPNIALWLLVGSYAQRWHLPDQRRRSMTAVVHDWAEIARQSHPGLAPGAVLFPMPHPSWRNTAWLKANPWFEADAIPALQSRVRALMG